MNHLCCMRADCEDHSCAGAEVARLIENEGGHHVDDFKVFPLTINRTETMPTHFRLKRAPDAFTVAMVGVLQWAPVVFFVIAVGTFWFLEVWSRKP